MEAIAGRKEEVAFLEGLLSKTRSEFVAVYGRRRIGKTFLVRTVYQNKIVFECSGLHQKSFKRQRENFWLALTEVSPAHKQEAMPSSWLQAFAQLKTYLNGLPPNGKKVIFFDEISWFDTPKAGFLAALDNFWNQYCTKRQDIILIICGSAASWIIQKVINDRGGLHNRITQHLQLMPFTLRETREFLEMNGIRWTLRDIALLYMSVGGVPFYLTDLPTGQSVPQVLDLLFFGEKARLKNEFQNLYAALFKNNALHERVVGALATKNMGMTRSELIAAADIPSGGALSTVLEELTACGFVKQIFPVYKQREDALYRLIDEYTLFYFKFLHSQKHSSSWSQICASPTYHIWTGYAFEGLCLKHISQIKSTLGISGIVSNDCSWQIKGRTGQVGAQIDLLIDRSDNCINLLEIKFHEQPFEMTKAYAERLQEKARLFKEHTGTRKNVFITLITAAGVVKNEYYLETATNNLDLENLFRF